MDWLKDITVEEFAKVVHCSFQRKQIKHGVGSAFVGDSLKTVNFAKCYNERYGTYFTYDMCISVPCVCDDEKIRSVMCKETRHIGQFGLLHKVDGKFTDFAVIGNFPEIELITPLHLDSFDLRKKYNLYEDDCFYYNGEFYDKEFLIGSYIKDAGQVMFNFVAQKNKGVLDENGRTYQEAYIAKQEQCIQDYITKHCNTIRSAINSGLKRDLKGIMKPAKIIKQPIESGEDE